MLQFDALQFDAAREQAASCLGRGHDGVDVRYVLASTSLLHGDLAGAGVHLDMALAMDPSQGRCLSLKGQLLMAQRRPGQAQEWLARAIPQMPQHVGSRHALGWCLILQEQIGQARALFEEALDMNRNFAESHGAMAVVLALEGRAGEARQAIARALRLDGQCLSAALAAKLLQHGSTLRGQALHEELLALVGTIALPAGMSVSALVRASGAAGTSR
jgi:Tfp pilus assembly protein PilF